MRSIRAFLLRLVEPLTRRRREADMHAEFESHLALHIEDNMRSGMAPAEARRAALIRLGGIEAAKEAVRDRRTLPLFNLTGDVRAAWRTAARAPWSTATVVVTLAIGIGVTTTVYAVFNYALFRPVPGVRDQEQLVSVYIRPGLDSGWMNTATHAHLQAMRQAPAFAGLAAHADREYPFQASAAEPRVTRRVTSVTRGYFEALGVRPRLGRMFGDEEYERTGAAVAVISEQMWRRQFEGSPAVVGKDIRLNGVRFTIVGVTRSYRGLDRLRAEDLWIPFGAWSLVDPDMASYDGGVHQNLVGRLRPGISLETARTQARAAFDAVGPVRTRDPLHPGQRLTYTAVVYPGLTDGFGLTRERILRIYWIASSGAGLLFLLACANVGNLLISRNLRRQRETGLKAALGASRLRLLREFVVEASLLSIAAGAVGLLLSAALAMAFRTDRLLEYLPPLEDLELDWRVVVFALAGALATVFLAGGVPALLAARSSPQRGLAQFLRGTSRGGRMRGVFVAVQVAMSIALVASAAVMSRTLYSLQHLDLGFDQTRLLTVPVRPRQIGYSDAQTSQFFRDVEERLNATPGVLAAGFGFDGQLGSLSLVDHRCRREYRLPRSPRGVRAHGVRARRSESQNRGLRGALCDSGG